jgi:hypothetical protein
MSFYLSFFIFSLFLVPLTAAACCNSDQPISMSTSDGGDTSTHDDDFGHDERGTFRRNEQYQTVRLIGGDGNEVSGISKIIESAFDTYRKNLITLVEGIDKVLEKMDQLNAKNNFKYLSIHSKMKDFALQLPIFWEENENILRKLLNPWELKFEYLILPPPIQTYPFQTHTNSGEETQIHSIEGRDSYEESSSKNNLNSSNIEYHESESKKNIASYNSMMQLLIHLDRDWSSFGKNVRKNIYQEGILPMLQRFVPLDNDQAPRRPRILVPGAGLGRLLAEIAALGYDVGKHGFEIHSNHCILINM